MPHPASPHKQRWTHVPRIFFPSLYRAGEGELLENFEKHALFHDSLCMDIPLGPPIVSEGRGGVCALAILFGSPEITESYKYYHEY